MISDSRLGWIQLCGVAAFAFVVFASLMLPEQVERMRTGHWLAEHSVGYFVASAVISLGWRRPFWVAGILTVAAFVLEGLQALTPNHSANLLSVLGGASGSGHITIRRGSHMAQLQMHGRHRELGKKLINKMLKDLGSK